MTLQIEGISNRLRPKRDVDRVLTPILILNEHCRLLASGKDFMKRTLLLIGLLLSAAFSHAQDVTGDWQGTLSAGGAELRLVLHLTRTPDGALHATLDSIDQNSNGIPVDSATLKDSKLNLDIPILHGSYQGVVAPDAKKISGTWTQNTSLPLVFSRTTTPVKTEHKPAKPSDIDGAWMGTLDLGAVKLRVVFHIVNTEDGLVATLDSPDQGQKGLPTTSVARDGANLKIEARAIGGVYEGKIAADLSSIDGAFTQMGASHPLLLKRVKDQAELELKRPQNPAKPYPYREEEVSYENKGQHVTLAATLTIPEGKGPFLAVLLITGSGPQDRDESLMGHKPFLVLSDYLTRHGIAVLRADDRGTGKSSGNFATATTADFATDAEAGVAYLKTRSEVDPHKIGLIGHSEGGVVAPMVAARNKDVSFIVLMAGTGVPGDQVLEAQGKAIDVASGKDANEAALNATKEKQMLQLVENEKDPAVLQSKLKQRMSGTIPDAQIGMAIEKITSPWMRYFLTYDPATALRKVTCPVLAINGSLDKQVLPDQNLTAIRKALEQSGNKHIEIDELAGLNHLFQTAKTGAPSEYAEIEETIAPAALEKVSSWILKQ